MSADTLPVPGLLPASQDTGHAAAGRGARSSRGAAQGPPVEATVDTLERLPAGLVRKLGAARARLLASLIDERADEAEDAR
jgi:hypothetical protein